LYRFIFCCKKLLTWRQVEVVKLRVTESSVFEIAGEKQLLEKYAALVTAYF
jgi:hypothetical protein